MAPRTRVICNELRLHALAQDAKRTFLGCSLFLSGDQLAFSFSALREHGIVIAEERSDLRTCTWYRLQRNSPVGLPVRILQSNYRGRALGLPSRDVWTKRRTRYQPTSAQSSRQPKQEEQARSRSGLLGLTVVRERLTSSF